MEKKVLIISTSARRNSNSDILADAFMNGAKDTGPNGLRTPSLIHPKHFQDQKSFHSDLPN